MINLQFFKNNEFFEHGPCFSDQFRVYPWRKPLQLCIHRQILVEPRKILGSYFLLSLFLFFSSLISPTLKTGTFGCMDFGIQDLRFFLCVKKMFHQHFNYDFLQHFANIIFFNNHQHSYQYFSKKFNQYYIQLTFINNHINYFSFYYLLRPTISEFQNPFNPIRARMVV